MKILTILELKSIIYSAVQGKLGFLIDTFSNRQKFSQ